MEIHPTSEQVRVADAKLLLKFLEPLDSNAVKPMSVLLEHVCLEVDVAAPSRGKVPQGFFEGRVLHILLPLDDFATAEVLPHHRPNEATHGAVLHAARPVAAILRHDPLALLLARKARNSAARFHV